MTDLTVKVLGQIFADYALLIGPIGAGARNKIEEAVLLGVLDLDFLLRGAANMDAIQDDYPSAFPGDTPQLLERVGVLKCATTKDEMIGKARVDCREIFWVAEQGLHFVAGIKLSR